MKCVIKECNEQAEYPGSACSREHGYRWKMIKETIKAGLTQYATYSGRFKLTDPEVDYYKQLIKE